MFLLKLKKNQKLVESDPFFSDDMDIFDQENVSEKEIELIMGLIIRTTFTADAKKYLEERDVEMEIPNDKQKIKKEEILVSKDEKMPDATAENKITKNTKIENKFEREMKKKKRKSQ